MNRDLIWLALALFTWGTGEGMFLYFQPIYLQRLGADPLGVGAILGAGGIAMTISLVPAGYLSDRWGRRPMIWLAWMVGLGAAWVMALARSLPLFVAGLLLYSTTLFVSAPLSSYASSARGAWSVGRALTIISASFSAGTILGPLLGGIIGERLGIQAIYQIAASIFVVSILFVFFIHPQPVQPHPEGGPLRLLSSKPFTALLAISFLTIFTLYLPQPLTPNYLQNIHGLPLTQIGVLGSAASLGNVIFLLALGGVKSSLGVVLGQASVGVFALLLWRGSGLPWFAAGYFFLGGFRAVKTMFSALARPLVHSAETGLAFGLVDTVNSLPVVLAPPLAGWLYHVQPDLVYPIGLALILAMLGFNSIFLIRRQAQSHETG